MKSIKRILILTIITSMVLNFFTGIANVVFAAPVQVNILVDDYQSGTLEFHLDMAGITGADHIETTYHTPAMGNVPTVEGSPWGDNEFSISGLESDYIYDIYVEVFDESDNVIAEAFLYYLPRITFYSARLEQESTEIDGGGYETGDKPELNLKWIMPKVYDGTDFVYADTALDYMEDTINDVYINEPRNISTMNFRINISTDSTKVNGGSAQAAVLIDYDEGDLDYKAKVSGNDDEIAVVNPVDANGYMSFNLIGRKDEQSDPEEPGPAEASKLRNWDILPGTVYYMNIKPVFNDNEDMPVNALTVGVPADQNGSRLSGAVNYTYTPIRFQLTKDGADNLYVKIFKINQGSLNLPRMYYEVQSSDDPSIPGDWTVKKTIDDSYFSSDYAITVVSGINPNNRVYYKIVVKSDSASDRLESPKMSYVISEDTSKPPLPMNVFIDPQERKLNTEVVQHPITNEDITVKSTDVTVSWDKPVNWDDINPETGEPYKNNIVFHFMLSTSQYDLEEEVDLIMEGKTWDSFVPKYRLVKYVHGISPEVVEEGGRLYYTLNAFDLFNGEYINGEGDPEEDTIDNPDDYPDFLMPNQVYYLKMFTTAYGDKGKTDPSVTSDMSIIKSFTTLAGVERDVPLPINFRLNVNDIYNGANRIELQFERVQVDWNNYGVDAGEIHYDLYMSNRTETDSFILIGSTDMALDAGDVTWVDNVGNSYVRAVIEGFNNPDAVTLFGEKLKPNSTYYFTVKTRLDIGEAEGRESLATAILPVTTVRGDVEPPDPESRIPLSPDDFDIAEDEDGNPMVSGSSVTFKWSKKEEGVSYQIICTTERVAPEAELSEYENDPFYLSFIETFGDMDNDEDDELFSFDPEEDLNSGVFKLIDPDDGHEMGRFTINETSDPEEFMLAISEWVFPNRLYYFSIKAELNGNESAWISIPVTTYLIDEATSLEALRDCQIGFFWTDEDISLKAEDFRIHAKGPNDNQYRALPEPEVTIIKDGTTYYARVVNLESDSSYNFRVYKGNDSSTFVCEKAGLKTRDTFHQVEVKWRGDSGYRYELAVKTADDDDYIVLSDINLEKYVDNNGNRYPYYIEQAFHTVGTSSNYYYARIKTAPVELQDGTVINMPLKSNTRYQIKVRAVKVDASDTRIAAYSKYVGPVDIRTEFSQDDYDDVDQDNKKEAIFNDRIKQLEEGYFWRMSIDSSSEVKILIKGDRVSDALKNNIANTFRIDISGIQPYINSNVIYIPLEVVRAMNSQNKSLLFKVPGAEYVFRPDTIDADDNREVKILKGSSYVKDIFVEVTIARLNETKPSLPSSSQVVSQINDFDLKVVGTTKTYQDIKELIDGKLYDEENGLVHEKLNILMSNNFGSGSGDSALMEEYTSELIDLIRRELSDYIDSRLDSAMITNSFRKIEGYDSPMMVKIMHNGDQGLKVPYAYYNGSKSWSKIEDGVSQSFNSVSMNVFKSGKYVILAAQVSMGDVPTNHPSSEYIRMFIEKYDLSRVFPGIEKSFYPDDKVSGKELVLLYELVMNRTYSTAGMDIREKSKALGLDRVIGLSTIMRDVTREKTAAVIIKVYCGKTGISIDSFRPLKNIYIADEDRLGSAYYKPVIMAVDLDVLPLDRLGNFEPDKTITRADIVTALVKILEKTGDV